MKKRWIAWGLVAVTAVLLGVYWVYQQYFAMDARTRKVVEFLRVPGSNQALSSPALSVCGDAPFMMPTTGMIGFIWHDSFYPGHHHQGIDIFGGGGVEQTEVYAAYDGFLTRLADWKSSVIIRIPSDPLVPERQIWTYYTHMADPDGRSLISDAFPPGTSEVFVSAGTFLGYQGNYSGKSGRPTGVHLHFSIVKDNGKGQFLNEVENENTLDPSPYFGLQLNADTNPDDIPICQQP